MDGVLKDIIDHKRREVAVAKARVPFPEMEALVAQADAPRNFFAAVTQHPDAFHYSVIAEVVRKSPPASGDGNPPTPLTASTGWLRPEYKGAFDPGAIAARFHANGAAAISCVTDEKFFGGELGFIERIRQAVPLPVLRRDFIIDPWQLWESRAAGADGVSLVADCLTIAEMLDMLILAQRLGLTVLLEVHSVETLLRVRPHVGFPHPSYFLLGINNRDPASGTVNLNHTLRLLDMVDDPSILVSESGIRTNKDATWLRHHGVRILLVGEHLLRAADPGAALAELVGQKVR